MTGNAKVWRAPLAGLASVAMIATMGVTAFTASAAESQTPTITWVKADGETKSFKSPTAEYKVTAAVLQDNASAAPTGTVSTGWYTAAGVGNGDKVKPDTTVSEDVTYYQHYSADYWTVKFDPTDDGANNSKGVLNAVTDVTGHAGDTDGGYQTVVAKGDKLAAWQVPTEKQGNGKLLTSWYATDENANADPVKGNLADYAKLNTSEINFKSRLEDAWTVEFKVDDFKGESWVPAQGAVTKIDVKKGAKFSDYGTVPEFTNAAGTRLVSSWKATKDGAAFDPSAAVNASVSLHPASSSSFVNVTFNYQGNGTADKTVKVVTGSSLPVPATPTRASNDNYEYTFGGWYDSTFKTAYNASSTVNNAMTVYAKWNISKVKVSFYPGYGENKPTTKWFANGDAFEVPAVPERDGYKAVGYGVQTSVDSDNNPVYAYAEDAEGYLVKIKQTAFGTTPAASLSYVDTIYGDGNDVQPYALSTKYTVVWEPFTSYLERTERRVARNLKSDQNLYTAASYAAYVKAFKAEYLPAKEKAAENGLNKTEFDTLLKQLEGLQAKLVETANDKLYRVYNPNNGDHYFTTDLTEQAALVKLGWKAEGAPYKVIVNRKDRESKDKYTRQYYFGTAVWSVYNPNTGEHLLTFESEANGLAKAGWTKEDVKFYTVQGGTAEVVRVYNPNTNGPAHLYTKASEARGLAKLGWKIDNNAKPVFNLSK
ncbi:InlB B-repeat-containing protein [Bifidobacterium biavatii]|uniref:Glycoside hydrolase, family 25 n=1 Tax=Bifidobacterium biavatii DSM 23969 TaxID=1437608 RepID=A0A086ZN14_9BIFI|nr:InlB B-repeat-containing protein [Bifidobacterium biavatii]KFI47914.1 Glycoside hydrolase, family 25 [Bifidobacterium biavatii DSM 23969]